MNRLVLTLAIVAAGAWLLWRYAGWQVLLGVVLVTWAANERRLP